MAVDAIHDALHKLSHNVPVDVAIPPGELDPTYNKCNRPPPGEGGQKLSKDSVTKHKLVHKVLEKCQEATREERARMRKALAKNQDAPEEVRVAAAMDQNLREALFKNEANLSIDLVMSMQKALSASRKSKPKGKKVTEEDDSYPAKVTTVVPKRVKIVDVNAAVQAANGPEFTPIPESSKSDGAVVCCVWVAVYVGAQESGWKYACRDVTAMRVARERVAKCDYHVRMKETSGNKATPQFWCVYDYVEGTSKQFWFGCAYIICYGSPCCHF